MMVMGDPEDHPVVHTQTETQKRRAERRAPVVVRPERASSAQTRGEAVPKQAKRRRPCERLRTAEIKARREESSKRGTNVSRLPDRNF